MSKKRCNKKKIYHPMRFLLNFVFKVDGSFKSVETPVSINFNSGVIVFLNSETPVTCAEDFVRSLPDFFKLRHLVIGCHDLDELDADEGFLELVSLN